MGIELTPAVESRVEPLLEGVLRELAEWGAVPMAQDTHPEPEASPPAQRRLW